MKKGFIFGIIAITIVVGSVIFGTQVLPKQKDTKSLYALTDPFVESLNTTVQSYGLFGVVEEKKESSNGNYIAAPLGRLVVVNFTENTKVKPDYDYLQKRLEKRYKNNPGVNQVYRNQAGTICIDCRN